MTQVGLLCVKFARYPHVRKGFTQVLHFPSQSKYMHWIALIGESKLSFGLRVNIVCVCDRLVTCSRCSLCLKKDQMLFTESRMDKALAVTVGVLGFLGLDYKSLILHF